MAIAPTRSQARLFAQLIAELEPRIRTGFMAAVTDLSANVNWRELLANLEAGDIEGAIAALNISPAAWQQYSEAVSAAYAASGSAAAAQIRMTGIGAIGTRFNMMNPRAEQWIRENVGESIVGFAEEQIEVARQTIAAGYRLGKGPRDIATDLAGRVVAGRRQGGVLGLDTPRAERLMIVTEAMKTAEGVRSLVIEHRSGALSLRYKVNKATANRILRAYRKEEAVPQAERLISERQYKNALLKARADTVARTETAAAVLNSRDEAFRQTMEQQGIRPDQVVKVWRHGAGATAYHRPDHLAMAGTEVVGIDTPFVFPDGTAMLYPHDPAGGAKHNINCRCSVEYKVNYEVD